MTLIQQSREELTSARNELEEQKKALTLVKDTYSEQKESYEKQLKEAEAKQNSLKTACAAFSASSVALTVALILVLLL